MPWKKLVIFYAHAQKFDKINLVQNCQQTCPRSLIFPVNKSDSWEIAHGGSSNHSFVSLRSFQTFRFTDIKIMTRKVEFENEKDKIYFYYQPTNPLHGKLYIVSVII